MTEEKVVENAWQFVYGSDRRSGVPDVYRASFRRMMTRTAIAGGAAIAASMHLATFVVNAYPRGVLGSMTAFFWQVVTMVPLTAVYVLAGSGLGLIANSLLMAIATGLHGRRRVIIDVLSAAIGLAVFGVIAGVFATPMLLMEADPRSVGVTMVLAPLVSAIGGALFGMNRSWRMHQYFSDRAGK